MKTLIPNLTAMALLALEPTEPNNGVSTPIPASNETPAEEAMRLADEQKAAAETAKPKSEKKTKVKPPAETSNGAAIQMLDPEGLEVITDPADPLYDPTYPTRCNPDNEEFKALVQNIKSTGFLIQNVVATKRNGKLVVIAGNSRTLAARKLGMAPIPVRIVDLDDASAYGLKLSENFQRQGLSTMDAVLTVAHAVQSAKMSEKTIARDMKVDPMTIKRYLTIASGVPELHKAVAGGILDVPAAVSVAKEKDPEKQREALKEAVEKAKAAHAAAKAGGASDRKAGKKAKRAASVAATAASRKSRGQRTSVAPKKRLVKEALTMLDYYTQKHDNAPLRAAIGMLSWAYCGEHNAESKKLIETATGVFEEAVAEAKKKGEKPPKGAKK